MKVVLVTGAGRGLGLERARELAAWGDRVLGPQSIRTSNNVLGQGAEQSPHGSNVYGTPTASRCAGFASRRAFVSTAKMSIHPLSVSAIERRTTVYGSSRCFVRGDPRAQRTTTLEVRATPVTLVRPEDTSATAKTLQMNLVDVREPNPPEGEDPIAWSLFTTEPINTAEHVLQVVDVYRTRWLFEEYFEALKTGCSYERLQFVSLHALHNALALCLPMAWQMLLLRSVARDAAEVPAKRIPAPEQCWVLRTIAQNRSNRRRLKLKGLLTAGVALHAIARLGGHPNAMAHRAG